MKWLRRKPTITATINRVTMLKAAVVLRSVGIRGARQ